MNATSVHDGELLDRWRAGDRDAGAQILRRHTPRLVRLFENKVNSPDAVDDLVQATLLACVQARDRVRSSGEFRVYVLGIARHVLFQHLRSVYRDGERFSPLLTSVADLETGLSVRVERDDEQRLLRAALRRIPLDLQLTLELVFWHGLTAPEVGRILQINDTTVRTRVHRAKARLREELQALSVGGSAPIAGELE